MHSARQGLVRGVGQFVGACLLLTYLCEREGRREGGGTGKERRGKVEINGTDSEASREHVVLHCSQCRSASGNRGGFQAAKRLLVLRVRAK